VALSSYENEEDIIHGLGETGLIPCVGKFLQGDDHDFALSMISLFKNYEEYFPQIISIGLVNLARVFQECEELFSTLCHYASPDQLIPAFSYFLSRLLDDDETNILDASGMLLSLVNSPTLDLTQVLPHVDAAEKILSVLSNCGPFSQEVLVNLSKILSALYLNDSPLIPVTWPRTHSELFSWQIFLSGASPNNLRIKLICPILFKIITNSDLQSIIDHNLICSLISQVKCYKLWNQYFTQWLLDLIEYAVVVRAKEKGREDAVLFIDQLLVELGILSSLMEFLNFKSPKLLSATLRVLKMMFRFDKKYEAQFKETPMIKFLLSLLDENNNSEKLEIDDLPQHQQQQHVDDEECVGKDDQDSVLTKRKRTNK
jgi:hypothetical protein